jgi:uncharacterized protein (TIGR02996 family)
MTDDELAFIRAATAEPADDTLRLVYADWLEEQGGETFSTQATFARLQVRRSQSHPADLNRVVILAREAALLRKHRRDWNGRIHRHLSRTRFPGRVDARRGRLRGWDYHRGMIARVALTLEALTDHAALVFALGPIAHVHLIPTSTGGWDREDERRVETALAGAKALRSVSVAGLPWPLTRTYVDRLRPFAHLPVLDLRAFGPWARPADLLALTRSGAISPVVLYRAPVWLTRQRTSSPGRVYSEGGSFDVPHVIDPHGRWAELGPWYSDLIGETLTPIPYQGTTA